MGKQTTIIIYGVLAIFLLTFGFYSSTMQYADAVTIDDITGVSPLGTIATQGDTYFDVSIGVAEKWIPTGGGVQVIDMLDDALVSTITISGGGVTDVKCGSAWCFAWQSQSNPFRIWAIDASTRSILGVINGTDANEGGYAIEVADTQTGGLGGISVFVPISNTDCDGLGGGNDVIAIMDGSIIAVSGTFNDACSAILSVGDFMTSISWSEQTQNVIGDNRNILAVRLLNAAVQNFVIFNLPTLTSVCSANLSNGDNWIVTEDGAFWTSSGVTVFQFNIPTSGTANCVADGSASLPATYSPQGLDINEEQGIVFINSALGAGTDSFVTARNRTSLSSELFNLDMPNGFTGSLTYYSVHDEVFAVSDAGSLVRVFGLGNPQGGGEGSQGGVDCDAPENANILICRLGGDGTLGSAGAFVIGNTTQGTGILGIGCSIGLVDCTTDDDPRTNGLGLLIFIASIFVIVGMFYRSLGASATFQLPVFIWVVIIIALSAFFTITNIIDPIFLVLSIIAVIALAVPKVVGMIQNRSFGGGGSTE